MKLHFLGTCAGTEPILNLMHVSTALEVEDRLYWFDAGEGCSRTGHLMGLDLLKIRSIFIATPHGDHMGGLINLLWNIRKLADRKERLPDSDIQLYISDPVLTEGIFQILHSLETGYRCDFDIINPHEVNEGVLYDDGFVKVTAYHNGFDVGRNQKKCVSYSYKMEAEGKKIIYSGDLKSYNDLDRIIEDGCDGLIIETGHFGIDDVRDYVKDKNIGKIFFSHNGREIINYPEKSQKKIDGYFEGRALICKDAMTVEI